MYNPTQLLLHLKGGVDKTIAQLPIFFFFSAASILNSKCEQALISMWFSLSHCLAWTGLEQCLNPLSLCIKSGWVDRLLQRKVRQGFWQAGSWWISPRQCNQWIPQLRGYVYIFCFKLLVWAQVETPFFLKEWFCYPLMISAANLLNSTCFFVF